MRKSLWIVPLVLLFAAIAPPKAHADEYTITFTGGTTTPVDTTITISASDVLSLGSVTDGASGWDQFAPLQLTATPETDHLIWTITSPQGLFILEDLTAGDDTFSPYYGPLAPGDTGTASITDISIATPEPGTASLMLLGIGLVFLMRKRIAQGLPQAT